MVILHVEQAIEKHRSKIGDIVDVSNEQTATLRSQLAEQRQINSDAKKKAKAYVESLLEETNKLQREIVEQKRHSTALQERLDEQLNIEAQRVEELKAVTAHKAQLTAEVDRLKQVVQSFENEGAVTRDQTAAQLVRQLTLIFSCTAGTNSFLTTHNSYDYAYRHRRRRN